ncbi:MAG: pantoate--beta-alanine ligase [Silicimonas sp.]|nr:pantoate--beta-alanine ligase [Silicimonas sp.]
MKICPKVEDIRSTIRAYHAAGETVGLVTTMGALHEGHLTLMRHAREDHDRVVATIFVNPTQFGEVADLAHYPSDDARDIDLLRAEGIDALFLPEVQVIYPPGDETIVETTQLAHMLHGKVRPGHFRGVATVVARLFNICQADAAYFGEKDYQQLQVIRRMTRDLHIPIEIHGVPTVREADGLAMSSRNQRLCAEDRAAAVILSQSLDTAETLVAQGTTIEALGAAIRTRIKSEPRATLRAVDIVAAETLAPVSGPVTEKIAIMLSAEFGSVLLLDQREISP